MANATQMTSYANVNQLTFTGRISATKVVSGKNGDFLAVTMITNIANDKSVNVTFNDSNAINGIMKLEANGKLPVGRMVTVTGTIDNVSEVYLDKAGEPVMRKRPELKLIGATILRGGLGALPKSVTATRVLQGTPVKVGTPVSDLTPEDAYSDNTADAATAPVDEAPAPF